MISVAGPVRVGAVATVVDRAGMGSALAALLAGDGARRRGRRATPLRRGMPTSFGDSSWQAGSKGRAMRSPASSTDPATTRQRPGCALARGRSPGRVSRTVSAARSASTGSEASTGDGRWRPTPSPRAWRRTISASSGTPTGWSPWARSATRRTGPVAGSDAGRSAPARSAGAGASGASAAPPSSTLNASVDLHNYWAGAVSFDHELPALQVEALRGGPALLMPGRDAVTLTLASDSRRSSQWLFSGRGFREPAHGGGGLALAPAASVRVSDRLSFSLGPSIRALGECLAVRGPRARSRRALHRRAPRPDEPFPHRSFRTWPSRRP